MARRLFCVHIFVQEVCLRMFHPLLAWLFEPQFSWLVTPTLCLYDSHTEGYVLYRLLRENFRLSLTLLGFWTAMVSRRPMPVSICPVPWGGSRLNDKLHRSHRYSRSASPNLTFLPSQFLDYIGYDSVNGGGSVNACFFR
jgi:hypothetical protein